MSPVTPKKSSIVNQIAIGGEIGFIDAKNALVSLAETKKFPVVAKILIK